MTMAGGGLFDVRPKARQKTIHPVPCEVVLVSCGCFQDACLRASGYVLVT